MLYYADRTHELDTQSVLAGIASTIQGCARDMRVSRRSSTRIHSDLVGAAIALGELHQAVADHLCPEQDDVHPETDEFMRTGVMLGRCVYRSHALLTRTRQSAQPVRLVRSVRLVRLLARTHAAVSALAELSLPTTLDAHIPEGYAFYSLYPEMYFRSLSKLVAEMPSEEAYFVIGIRSIGTSLAALNAGALLENGHQVRAETLRPRGHPFAREIRAAPGIRDLIERSSTMTFVIADEGPGLTCSSFLSVCDALEAMGVPEGRIGILSAWKGAPSIYASDELRARWQRQRVFCTGAAEAFGGWRDLLPFVEDTIGCSDQGSDRRLLGWNIQEISYGMWREICYNSRDSWPTVHRPMERTKLLLSYPEPSPLESRLQPVVLVASSPALQQPQPAKASIPGATRLLAKFAGLGSYGRDKYERAKVLAAAGFTPPVAGLANGFILHRFVDGRPLDPADMSPTLAHRIAQYYAFVAHSFRLPPAPRFEQLADLILYNVRRAIDADASGFIETWKSCADRVDSLPLSRLDGRPFPHEWIETAAPGAGRYLKTDAVDHCLDHTLVGEQSILWDLAGACEEWEMSPDQLRFFLDSWKQEARDGSADRFLEFYRVAYLAFRTASLHYAIHSTNEEDIRLDLQHQQFKVNSRLRTTIEGRPTRSQRPRRSTSPLRSRIAPSTSQSRADDCDCRLMADS